MNYYHNILIKRGFSDSEIEKLTPDEKMKEIITWKFGYSEWWLDIQEMLEYSGFELRVKNDIIYKNERIKK